MKKPRSVHQTQWAAQFAVASELCKQGYQVALTLGNHPTVDLMVVSPSGKQFLVDVKGQYRPNSFWLVKRTPKRDDLFYVLAYVPDNAPNEFFVMTQQEVEKAIEENTSNWLAELKGLPNQPTLTALPAWKTRRRGTTQTAGMFCQSEPDMGPYWAGE